MGNEYNYIYILLWATVAIVLIRIIISNVKSAIYIYLDCAKRGIDGKYKYAAYGLLFNVVGEKMYMSATSKPQTSMSLSAPGRVAGDRFEGRSGKSAAGILFLIFTGNLIYSVYQFYKTGFSLDSNDDGGPVSLSIIVNIFLMAYFGYAYFNPGKLYFFDRSVVGMKNTEQGPVDQGLTKRKFTIITLLVIIVLLIIGLAIYLKYFFR